MIDSFIDMYLEYAYRVSEAEYHAVTSDPRDAGAQKEHLVRAAHYRRCMDRVRVLIESTEGSMAGADAPYAPDSIAPPSSAMRD